MRLTMCVVLAVLGAGCGDAPVDWTKSPVAVPACDPYAVGGNRKCGTSDTPAFSAISLVGPTI